MHVIWDWNGTLLDDVPLAVDAFNAIARRCGLQEVTETFYRAHFTFPVRDFYRLAGVTDEQFPRAAAAWNDLYAEREVGLPLRLDALPTVQRLHRMGHVQGILSAAHTRHLRRQLSAHGALAGHMAHIIGTDTIYGEGKLHLGMAYLASCGADPRDVVMVGDTCHDAEVARGMGVRCVLVEGGHQAGHVLARANVPVYPSLTAWLEAEMHHRP